MCPIVPIVVQKQLSCPNTTFAMVFATFLVDNPLVIDITLSIKKEDHYENKKSTFNHFPFYRIIA